MELRGPARYQHPFDLALVEFQLGFSYVPHYLPLTLPPHANLSKIQPRTQSPPTLVHLLAQMADPLSAGAHIPIPHTTARSLVLRTQPFNLLAESPQMFIEISTLSPVLPSSAPSFSSSRSIELDSIKIKVRETIRGLQEMGRR
jgi:hypothetical protein